MKAKEPASVYYNQPLMNAMRRNIRTKIEEESDPEVLSKVCALLDRNPQGVSFEERFERAREFAYAHFSREMAQELEANNFMIDKPFPMKAYHSEEELWNAIEEAESGGVASQEDVDNLFASWEGMY